MKNHKAFLFETNSGKPFAVVFLLTDDDKIVCKSFGHDAFVTRRFEEVVSVNYTTDWLTRQGCSYIKRLPFMQGCDFDIGWEKQVKGWVQAAQMLSPSMIA